MSQLFNSIKVGGSARSTFDLSHHQVTTSDFGYLIPICYRDMLPNDEFVVKPDVFCRLAPLALPCYGKIKARIHHFFVPYRILYPKWPSFVVQDASNHTIPPYMTDTDLCDLFWQDPAINVNAVAPNIVDRGEYLRLASNLGLNPNLFDPNEHSLLNDRFAAFPFLAYYRIWMDYFMDSNIYSHTTMVESFNQQIANGGALAKTFVAEILKCRSVCYKKDYFTTAKLDPQSGSAAIVPVDIASSTENPALRSSSYNSLKVIGDKVGASNGSSLSSTATSVIGHFTAEAMRFATALQRYSERSNFVGSKLINQMLVHFGITPTPERLDMAEFIGGDSFNIQIGDVTSTTGNSSSLGLDTFGLGTQAGKGIGAKSSGQFSYHAKEHGIWMSLLSILPDTGYYQGVSRFWFKGVTGDALDYATPEFANLGYQEVLNKEVFVPYAPSVDYQSYDPDGIFGYQPRFSEYRFQQDVLGSDFVAKDTSGSVGHNMDAFHLFRELEYDETSPLALNENFVECKNLYNSYDRIFQVTNTNLDHFYFNIDVDVKATRDLPPFGEPALDAVNNLGDGNKIDVPYGGTRL